MTIVFFMLNLWVLHVAGLVLAGGLAFRRKWRPAAVVALLNLAPVLMFLLLIFLDDALNGLPAAMSGPVVWSLVMAGVWAGPLASVVALLYGGGRSLMGANR